MRKNISIFNKVVPKEKLAIAILFMTLVVSVFLQSAFVSDPSASLPNSCISSGNTTLDPRMQAIVKASLTSNLQTNDAVSGSVLIIDANTGAVRALAGLTNKNGQLADNVAMCNLFGRNAALSPWEPGSVMKPLLFGAALDKKSVNIDTTYYETNETLVKERLITNAENFMPATLGLQDIITRSLNTGAVFVLRSLGNGKINQQARNIWYDYLTNHYRFGTSTGLGLAGESAGYVRKPSGGRDLELRYANMSFGIGLTVTPIQLASAYAALVNGGTYYQPYIYAYQVPRIVESAVVSASTSSIVRNMLQVSLQVNNPVAVKQGFIIGAKSGTAPSPDQSGSYKISLSDGTYVGFIGKDKPGYVILVRFMEPQTAGLASGSARIAWTDITNKLIDQGLVN